MRVPADNEAARAPPAAGPEAARDLAAEGFSEFLVPLIASAWNQTHGECMLPWIADCRAGGTWDAAVRSLRDTRVPQHPLGAHEW